MMGPLMNDTEHKPNGAPEEQDAVESTLRKITHDLEERVKELQCLYAISELLEKPNHSLEQVLQSTVDMIPPAWQYPDRTCARLYLDRDVYTTRGFREGSWTLSADVVMRTEPRGSLEVHHIGERPEAEGSPFLEEERRLIKAIAEKLGRILWVKTVEKDMRESDEKDRRPRP